MLLYASECKPATASAASPCTFSEIRAWIAPACKERLRVTASASSLCTWATWRHCNFVDVVAVTDLAVTCSLCCGNDDDNGIPDQKQAEDAQRKNKNNPFFFFVNSLEAYLVMYFCFASAFLGKIPY